MPIFDNNGKKQNVQDAHVEKYMELYPDATTIMEREGKKYRVKAKDYNTFLGDTLEAPKMESAPQPAPRVEAEPQQGFFDKVKGGIADAAKQAMRKPRGGENGYTFTAEELGIEESNGNAPVAPVELQYDGTKPVVPGMAKEGGIPGIETEAYNANMAKAMAEGKVLSPQETQRRFEEREAEVAAALPQANASMLQKMHEGATMQGAFDRAYGAAKGVYYADEAERLTKGLLDEYSAERAKRLSQVEKDVENYNSARRWAVSNPYATDAYSEVAYRSNVTKLRNADELGMMEEFAKDAKKRLLADENLKAKAKENAELLGMPVERYINEVAVPIMQERMYSEWLAPQEERAKRNYNGLAAAAEGSLIGTLLGATRTDTEKYLSQVGQESWRKNASLLGRAAAGAGSMFLDLPVFMGAGSLAAQPAKAVGGQVFKQLAKNETKRLVARGVTEGAAQRYANYAVRNGLKNRILLNLSTAPLQSGLTFGMFDAGKAALNMSLNGEWDWSELGKSAVGGTLMGGALGVTGAVGGGLTHGLTGATKAAAKVAEFGVENAVFTEGGRLIGKLHGQQPENGWLEDYVESGATLLMLKAPNIVKNVSAIKGDKEASEVFAFNRLEREQLGKYGEDLNAVLESLLPKSGRLYEDGLKINEGTFTEEYRRVMSDPEVSMTAKAKLMGIVEGKMMPAPKVVDAKIEGNRVMTYDPMGRLVEVKEYATEAKANAEYKKVANAAEVESIAVMEDMYMRIKGYEADDVTVREWLAKNPKVTMERVAEIVAKNSAGEKLTEAEQKILESLRQARREGLNDVRHLNDVLAELDVDAKDVMSGLDKPIDKRTERENRAVRAYTDVLFREVKDKIQEPYRRGEAQRAADDVWRAANNVRWANEDVKLLADRIYESDRQIDETANDGMVYTTTTPSGEKIIITGGKVVLDNEGYIDVNQSEGLVAMFPDGQKKPVRPGDLREKVEVSNAEEVKAAKREEIEQEIAAENGWKPIEVGAEYDVVFNGDAFRVKVEGRDENGDVIISGEGASIAVPESFLQDAMKQAEAVGEMPIATEPVVAPKTALEQIPRNENNIPLYEQVDSELAWDGVVEEAGGNEETAMVAVNSMVEDKRKALAAAEKAKAKAGVTITEKIAAENKRVANIEKAKADLAKWEEIAGVKAKRALAAEAESKRVADEAAAKQRAEEERLRAEREAAERAEREALNGVPDMVDDKPQDARARGYRRVNGHKVDRQEPVQGLMGKEIAVKFSDSSIPTGRVAVIEAEQLQPSHIQGQRNPLHFIDEAQPKERNDAASVLSARKIAENVRPEEITSSVTAYTGAPTVNTRGEAVQGNNRSAALRLMWENNPEQAAKYKQYLMDHAAEFGLNAENVAAMKSPVLVNMLDVSDADAITLGQYVAQDTESGGTERIKPKNVMQKMGGDMRSFANKLLASNNEEASFAELVDANGVEVLKWMAQKGYITPTQYKSAFDSKGNLTAEVKNDLRDVMYQSIFKGGSTQLEEMFNALPAKAQKAILATAFRDYDSPSGERMNGEVQNTIRAYYALARDAAFANAKNYKEAKEAAMMWARQYQLDDVSGESFLPSENFSNFAIELAVKFKGETQKTLQNLFNNIYDLIQGTKEASLFEEADNTPRTLKEAIKETLNIDYNGQYDSNSLAGGNKAGQPGRQGTAGSVATGERIEGGERPADSTGRARGNGEVSSPEIPNNQIPGLKGYTTDEVLNLTKEHITDILGGDISIVDMRVIGSRSNGTNSENSDLDVLVEFDGDISEDAFFNAVNGEDALYIDGVRVDINPITKDKSGTIEQWMNRNAGYSKTEGGNAPGQSGVSATLIKGAKWENTGEPDKIKSSRKKGDSHDITWYIGKKKYGSTTAERDLLVILAEDYGGDLNAVWNAYEQGKVLLGANEAAILKKLIETNTSAAELQQGVLELDRENPAFERATENVRKKLEATGVKVKVLTKEEAESELARLEKAQRQVVNSRMSKLDKVSRAIMNWLKNNTRNRRFEIELPVATQRKIRKEMGRDFDTHSITANEIAHSKKNHGVNGIKNTSNSIPLRDEDFALIPYIMTSPSYVKRGSFSTDGSESIRFYKTLSNGYVVVVEKEQKNSPDDMATISMWAELSANVPNARNMRPSNSTSKPATVANNTGAGTVIISPDDVAKIRKDAENTILFDTKVEKMVYGGNSNQEIFVSNAQRAVEEIKQEKATPQQWLAMIKKNGVLKAGEDKWMGLSEWLENNESKSLTKQEVLDFVNENAIKIEEVRYSQFGSGMMDQAAKKLEAETKEIGWDAMQEKYPGIEDFFEYYNGEVLWSESMASEGEYEDFILENKIVDANPADNAINERRESYTTEGLERKREIALVVPTIEPYNQSDEIHFGDAGDGRAVAWVRFGETTDSEGNRVLVIDEIQSKRHQDGREKGYRGVGLAKEVLAAEEEVRKTNRELTAYREPLKEKYNFKELGGSMFERLKNFDAMLSEEERITMDALGQARNEAEKRLQELRGQERGIPSAPFEKNWQELAMKRMLRLAAEEGFDKVAWTTGEQQAERYNIGSVVEYIDVSPYKAPGSQTAEWTDVRINAGVSSMDLRVDVDGNVVSGGNRTTNMAGEKLADVVGKELADKILSTKEDTILDGESLRIGGEGMKGFYDKMLPSFVSKYTKKWGAKVGTVEMPSLEQNNVMHSVDVTPEMKESVMEGQTMFLRTPDGVTYGWAVNGEIYLTPEGLNPNTPIHEYTHLWAAALQKSNPKLWGEVMEAMKLSPAWNEVMADENYTDIHGDDNRVASEVLSRLSGNEGYRRYMEQAEKEIAAERDIVGKVQKKGILNRIKNAVSRFWNWLKGKLGSKAKAGDGTEAKAEPWDVFVNKTLKDFDEGVNPDAKDSPLDRMFIGKKGAANLDKAEEATTRLDNLNVAREMEAAGKDAKAIKLATGWERGADGKWRYETDDVKVNRGAELFSLETYKSYPIAGSIEIGRVDENSTIKLTSLVKDDELFKAYPEMEEYYVSFEKMPAETKGSHSFEEKMIRINKDNIHSLGSTLVHEIQHAVQSIEGFAKGGNVNMENPETVAQRDKNAKFLAERLDSEYLQRNDLLGKRDELNEKMSAWYESHPDGVHDEEMDEYNRQYDELDTRIDELDGKIAFDEKWLDTVRGVNTKLGESGYKRLAGEVEARNAQKRMGYTEEQRRNELATETEDVSRKDQIFILDNLGVSASQEVAPEQDIPVGEVESKPLTFAEKITNSVLEASAKNKENLALRSDALRMYGRDVANVLKLMGKQREYDKSTVDQLVKLAKMYFKDAQLLGGLTPYQVGRVMTRLNNAVGKRDITDDANELVNILVDAHNKELEKMLEKQAKTKAKKVNASGVEVIGKLDKEGQLLLEEYNTGKELDLESIDEKIIDLQNEAAEGKAEEAAARIRGLELARQYREEILAKQTEIKGLEQELKSAEQDAKDGAMDRAAYKEFRRATERAILESKLEMVDAYHGLIHGLGGDISSSAKRAKLFQQAQIDHVKEIQHNANSDLLGHPAEAQGETPDKWNSSVPRFFMSAMPTFQTMLKFFGEKAADGRGYLYERFIPQHTQASHNEYVGKTEAREKMRDKLTEIFGKKTTIENFMDMSRKEGAVLEYQEGGQKKTIDLTRGQVLYLYMINKMADGQMKLSRMGITDADVQKMAKELPEEFVKFADWVQEDFLTELRDKYNAVHERMFGAPMAAIESYFPIKINKRSRGEKVEPGLNVEDKPSTVTGSVIKRTKNAIAIDLSADAMQVLLGHIDDMENWAAWAEFRRDLKSLLNYRHFQNQVKGMESLRYGSGEKLWKNFVDVANIAAGSFKTNNSNADKLAMNIAKGFVSSKIAFRYFTALKQILSTPAFWSEADLDKMIHAYLHQKEAWDWAIKELPGFRKRWEGRAAGNEILLESDKDWEVWRNRMVDKLSKEGMRANAFIDALTVATGAKAVFETKYEMFKKAGYSEERAREKALNRAAEAYNESQQSSESAYLSPLQADRTWLTALLTAYRNSPFGYNRKGYDAVAGLKKMSKKGYKQESVDFMTKQIMRDGLNEEQAKRFAESVYKRSKARHAANAALFLFFLNYIWELGPDSIYDLLGDDDEKKKEQHLEDILDGAMGGFSNLPAGGALVGAIKAMATQDASKFQLPKAVATQDIENLADVMQMDFMRGVNELLNAVVAARWGFNPQTFTDMVVAFSDVEGFNAEELGMLIMRIANFPNSQLELLEADKAMENYGEKMEEITREYAEYQKSKRAPLTGWLYSDEAERKALERYEKRFKKILDERFETIVEDTGEYDAFYENSDPLMKAKLAKLRQKFLEGDKETTMEKLDSIDVTKKVLFGSGYDEVNTVYYELSTAEDEDMAMMIDAKLKELTPMMDEYKKLRGDERKAYREENLEQIQFYNRLNAHKNNVNNLKGAMKKKPEEAQEKMEKIRKIRTKAIDLINNYNE